ncbi:MAG: ParA family protein [Rhodococcus sp. (in: high G+C Gram-positive bacteria)]|uniref:MinD/ParA family ATP-binding protein n=1 Tax=Rhodococcus sp. TaxID=1831 RepID=UPI002ACE1EEF|nr:ParA family protein [Mycobacterium sp.]MDZ7914830.1 ParA family protein [Rhodococcus sp. (in: high G+C Gram-positive bacteria)]
MAEQQRRPDESAENPVAGYDAEDTVNLRAQRLRRPETEPGEQNVDETIDEPAPDPYGVGQDALAAVDAPAVDAQALYRARLFDRQEEDLTAEPAEAGLRGRLNAALGTHLRPKSTSTEVRLRQSIRVVQQPLPGCSVVSVINPKGGAGKTPTSVMLGSTFGKHRGHGVTVFDASESLGSLGDRAARTTDPELTVWDLLDHAHELASSAAVSGSLSAFLRRQPTLEDILAADNSANRERNLGWDECAAVMAVLRRHRELIVIDTAANPLAESWQWAVQHSDALVVPLPLRLDIARQVYQMLEGIVARGYGHLLSSTIVVTCATPDSNPQLATAVFEDLRNLGVQDGNFIQAPYEPALARGDRIVHKDLPPATIEAYTNVTALVADNLAAVRREAAYQFTDPYSPQPVYRQPDTAPPQLSQWERRSRDRRGA